MEKNIKPQQQKKTAVNASKVRSGYIYALAAVIVVSGIYYLLAGLKVFSPRQKVLESLMASYQLYTPKDEKMQVSVFYGDPDAEGFKLSNVQIFQSEQQINQIKQALIALCQGPPKGCLNLLPDGTTLREAYLDPNSVLYIDLSQEFTANAKGGTTGEYQAVYSVLNTVFYNFKWVKGIRILIKGEEKDTAAGHISIKDIMTPDTDFSDITPAK
jgi:hypothetical protein